MPPRKTHSNLKPDISKNSTSSTIKKTGHWIWSRLAVIAVILAIFWILELVDSLLLSQSLNQFGIRPRDTSALKGILLAPFLHGDLGHLISNTVPFAVLAWFVMLRSKLEFLFVSLITTIVGGFGTWLIGGSNTLHIGASGVVFGYLGFLLLRGFFERSLLAVSLSVVTALLYGGLLWGVLPGHIGVSWEGHLFGFLGGVLSARLLTRPKIPEKT